MYRIPALLTVAGVANLKSLISKINLMWGLRGTRSLDAKVSILLSSMTEFILSIQFASRSPSNMIHLGLSSGISPRSLITLLNNPSFHSLVAILMNPYNSSVLTDLGLISTILVFSPRPFLASARVFHAWVLPAPGGPITNTQCLICNNSSNCTTFSLKTSSGWFPMATHAFATRSSRGSSTFLGGSIPGKRSLSRPKNTTSSSRTILGMLKSLSARINSASSRRSGSSRLNPPATTSTDFTARSPQS
mmetsp:Transcript_13996/g.13519  ORF Transcript_13996/g.13519 Transcript_13996/m.13519 type:complete len:248 (-) Transcript_13996:622-1365(-)